MTSCVHIGTWVGICLATLGAHRLSAQPPADRAKDEAAVRQAGNEYRAAAARGDAKAAAECWTDNGSFTDLSGRTVKVRELPAAGKAEHSRAASNSAGLNVTVRFVGNDVAIEEGDFDLPAGDDRASPQGHYLALWVRDGKRWKLDSVYERPLAPAADADQLASLDVLVGDWTAEGNKIAVQISAHWEANKKFLSRQITMTAGKASLIGKQTIGRDPISRQIRSWTFFDDGSYSEGVWSLEGNAWMAPSTRVLPDGNISTVTQVYKFPDKNTFVWKLIRGSVAGQPTDDLEVVFKRSNEKR